MKPCTQQKRSTSREPSPVPGRRTMTQQCPPSQSWNWGSEITPKGWSADRARRRALTHMVYLRPTGSSARLTGRTSSSDPDHFWLFSCVKTLCSKNSKFLLLGKYIKQATSPAEKSFDRKLLSSFPSQYFWWKTCAYLATHNFTCSQMTVNC